MKSTFNGLLSDIYRMLSVYEEKDFLEASRARRVDPMLREILRAFARSARESSYAERHSNLKFTPLPAPEPDTPDTPDSSEMVRAILAAILALSSDKTIEIFGRNGVFVEKRAKESRDRLSKRLSGLIKGLGSSRRRKLLDDLSHAAGGQTAGWIAVLRNRG